MYKVIRLKKGDLWPSSAWATSDGRPDSVKEGEEALASIKRNYKDPEDFKKNFLRVIPGGLPAIVNAPLVAVVWEDEPTENEFGQVMP